jgi:hypothetical protein
MVIHCYRCTGTLDEEATFCPHCAAPQLRVAQSLETAEPATAGSAHTFLRDPRAIDWHNVIRLAVWTAIPVGLVAPFFFPMVIAGPIILISMYQRRRPAAPLDGKAGFRIGALMGVLAAYVSAFGLAAWQIFHRYGLHQGSAIDAQYAAQVQQYMENSHAMAQANSLNAQQARLMLDFMLSADGRVTYTFFSSAFVALGIIVLAGLGGILGARLTRRSTSH